MRYKKEHIEFVKKLVESGEENVTSATRLMCEHFKMEYREGIGRSFRDRMQRMGVTNNGERVEDSDMFKEAQNRAHDSSKKYFIISWAQSETKVHKQFIRNMEAYAKKLDAGIHIIAGRYRNPTSLSASNALKSSEKDKNVYWHSDVLPYLDAARHKIHKYLCILSDVKVQPTATTPLSGMNGLTGLESCILGHPRIHMNSLPVLDGYPNKLLVTTGACTVENYTDTKAGKKGEFHHQLGFVIVELDGDIFHIRQVVADSKGNFYDLVYKVKNGKVEKNKEPIPVIVFGDLHLQKHNKEAMEKSFEMVKKLNIFKIILHDVSDSFSISHHEKKEPFVILDREEDGSWRLEDELSFIVEWFKMYKKYQFVVVRSNHDEHIDKWLSENDWRKSPNKMIYLKLANILAEGKAKKGVLPYILETELDNVKALGIDESYRVLNWELGMHGHMGASGSRGSMTQFKNLNTKTVTGHSHTPKREDGAISVGTLTNLRVGYNKGANSWMHSNVVIYPNGKASHINIIKGKYTTLI